MINSENEKTYRFINLKYIYSFVFLLTLSVVILLYLLSVRTFLPFNDNNEYIWLNIFTFGILISNILFSFVSLLLYIFTRYILKKEDSRYLKIFCIKVSFLFTVGFCLVLILNFLHILNIYWGLGTLLVLILLFFVF